MYLKSINVHIILKTVSSFFVSEGQESTFYSLEALDFNLPFDATSFAFKVYEMIFIQDNPTVKNYQRSIYNLLDFIGDVVSLLDGLKLFE